LINPVGRAERFDHPDWLVEAKFDGFRPAAHTDRGRLISRNGSRMAHFEEMLAALQHGQTTDLEIAYPEKA
jgi:ATP-dependent DNA ligase